MLTRSAVRARGLFVSRLQNSIGRHPAAKTAARSFSSPPDRENSSRFKRAYNLVTELWNRSHPRLPVLQEWQEKGVFIDSLSATGQVWLFLHLHLPKKTTVDLVEFTEGARIATEANLRAMNSAAFPEFLAGKKNSSSDVADRLQQYTTPAYYNQMALRVKKNYLQRNFYVECEELIVEKAQLAGVGYRRLTEKQYEDLVAFKKPPAKRFSDATIEHLQLYLDVSTVEVLNVVRLDGKTNYVQNENVYRVVFESRVTDPEEVDWRIENMFIIEQKAVQRP
ncbi:hypothetical protein PR002_g28144 [Phytophthora rubi]|uniref:Uncharacterized protein n=2 Tax=Phytophthora rubi TaxID=129364 RepID=A0A6A3HBI0_9STRA|nr:hypothetical protein PR002_g28144 [Phytophthora rubi]